MSERTAFRKIPTSWMIAAAGVLFLVLATLGAVVDPWRGDEAYTEWISSYPPAELVRITIKDVHPPLYYLNVSLFRAFLPLAVALKLVPMLWGLTALLLLSHIAWRVAGERAAGLTALLCATFPQLLNRSQDSRMYTMVLALQAAAFEGCLLRRSHPRLGWLLFVGSITAGLYAHNLMLFIAVIMIAGELLRSLYVRFRHSAGEHGQDAHTVVWILTAAAAIAILYLPWIPVLRQQSQNALLLQVYNRTELGVLAGHLWGSSYFLHLPMGFDLLRAIPGFFMLAVLPLVAITAWLRRGTDALDNQMPRAMFIWVAVLPMLAVAIFSWLFLPIFEPAHQGVIFNPLLLTLSAIALSSVRGNIGRIALIGGIGALAFHSWNELRRPIDADFRPLTDSIVEHAPLGAPVYCFPVPKASPFMRLLWSPVVPRHKRGDESGRRADPIVLVTHGAADSSRELVLNRTRLLIAKAGRAERFFNSYYLQAYVLSDFDPNEIFDAEGALATPELKDYASLLQAYPATRSWKDEELLELTEPRGEMFYGDSNFRGMRLAAEQTQLTLPLPPSKQCRAIIIAGRQPSVIEPSPLTIDLNGQKTWSSSLTSEQFVIVGLAAPGDAVATFSFEIPNRLANPLSAAHGDYPRAIYLAHASASPLAFELFKPPGFEGCFFDIGNWSDDLFVREGFYEREGAAPKESRWSGRHCLVQLPTAGMGRISKILLYGQMPGTLKSRVLHLKLQTDQGEKLEVSKTIELMDDAIHFVDLPEPFEADVLWLGLELEDVWIPKETMGGNDSRELGFNLNAIVVR